MDEVMVFANPIAGRGKGSRIARRVEQGLERMGLTPRMMLKKPADLTAVELDSMDKTRAVVAIGGDGTLRSVVQRLVNHRPKIPPVVVVPMGTANLMGRYLGVDWDEQSVGDEVARVITTGQTIEIDTARINERQGELMLLVAGVGIDGKIVHELDRIRKGPISYLSYALPAAMALGFYEYPHLRVDVDGEKVWQGAGIALIGNVKEYGTGFPVLPMARPDDGLLDVCAMPCKTPGELVKLFLQTAAGEHLTSEGVVYVKGNRVRITSEGKAPVQVDGEAAGFTPITFEMMDSKVPFLIAAK